MKKERVNIEELFKQKFDNAEIKPGNLVWNKLENNFNTIPKKLTYFRWFLSVVTVSMAVFLYWIWPSMQYELKPLPQKVQIADTSTLNINQTLPETVEIIPKETKSRQLPSVKNTIEQIETKELMAEKETTYQEKNESPTNKLDNTLNEKPEVITQNTVYLSFSASEYTGCAPLEVIFENTSINASDFEWNMGDGFIYTDKSVKHVYEKPGLYIVSLTSGQHLNLIKSDTIIVYGRPSINAAVSIKESAHTNELIVYSANQASGEKLKWSFGDGHYSDLSVVSHAYSEAGNYDVFCYKTTTDNCTDSVFVKRIIVLETNYAIEFPTAFAPNIHGEPERQYSLNANKNELFFPVYKGVAEYNLKVYNRYGALLFETNDIKIAWTGYFKGKLVAQEVYIYKATGKFENGKPFSKAGNVTVVY